MKNRFSIFINRSRGGIYYLKDRRTGQRDSLETKDKDRALELLTAHNEAAREPAFKDIDPPGFVLGSAWLRSPFCLAAK